MCDPKKSKGNDLSPLNVSDNQGGKGGGSYSIDLFQKGGGRKKKALLREKDQSSGKYREGGPLLGSGGKETKLFG